MKRRRQRSVSQLTNYVGYPNLSSLAVCGRASPASRNEELSDARHSNRSGLQAGKISPRTRRRPRLAPSAGLHRLRLHPRPNRRLGAGAGTAKGRVAPKPGGEFQRCSPRWRRQPRTLTTASKCRRHLKAEEVMRLIADIYDRPSVDFRSKADLAALASRLYATRSGPLAF